MVSVLLLPLAAYVGQAAGTASYIDPLTSSPIRTRYVLPSACDPDDFKFATLTQPNPSGQTPPNAGNVGVKEGEYRLALSRVCVVL